MIRNTKKKISPEIMEFFDEIDGFWCILKFKNTDAKTAMEWAEKNIYMPPDKRFRNQYASDCLRARQIGKDKILYHSMKDPH